VRKLVTYLVVAAAVLATSPAFAADTWTDPAPGVRHLTRVADYAHTPGDTYRAHGLIIDLTHPSVDMLATPPDQKGGVVSDFASRNGLEAAWNTNFFANTSTPCGMMMGNGQVWQTAYEDACDSAVAVGGEQAAMVIDPPIKGPAPEGWMQQLVSGKPGPILVDGEPQFSYGCGTPCAYQPRTGLGVSQDGTRLIVAVIDGRSSQSVGAGLDDLANFMKELGAWDAVNLDGGGSTTMYVASDGGVVNEPSDGVERAVCCHMGVKINDAGTPAAYAAELVETSDAPTLAPGESAQVWAEFRNTGGQAWRASDPYRARLGTQDPQDRSSPFVHSTWDAPNRVGPVSADVAPGESYRWTFTLRAPDEEGSYDESFSPVIEGVTWLDSAVATWTIDVAEPDADPDTGSTQPDTGPDGDAEDTKNDSDTSNQDPDAEPADATKEVTTTSSCATATGLPNGVGAILIVAGIFVFHRRKHVFTGSRRSRATDSRR
jgi:hypothetical protein